MFNLKQKNCQRCLTESKPVYGQRPSHYYCLRPKAKDLGITWVVVVLGFFIWSMLYQLPPLWHPHHFSLSHFSLPLSLTLTTPSLSSLSHTHYCLNPPSLSHSSLSFTPPTLSLLPLSHSSLSLTPPTLSLLPLSHSSLSFTPLTPPTLSLLPLSHSSLSLSHSSLSLTPLFLFTPPSYTPQLESFQLLWFPDTCPSRWLFNIGALQEYLLVCCQDPRGGMIDKPGKSRDFYHT